MRRIAWGLLLLFAFTIPWEFSLNLGEPLGHVARIAGALLILAAIPAVLQAGRLRKPGLLQCLVLALYLWICCTYFWTVDADATLEKMRAYFQELMVVWMVWEFAESPGDLRDLLRAFVAGSWVLAILTVANALSPQAVAEGQIRFAATGEDPNDVARFLDLGFPLAALLLASERRWPAWLLAMGYLPLGLGAVLLTASRGGFLAAVVALIGCAVILVRSHARGAAAGMIALPAIAAALWFSVPHETLERLGTIPEQLQGGDLNQRMGIWDAGWQAFVRAPLMGTGAGSFVCAAGLGPFDSAHNTALSIMVGGGLCALFLTVAIAVVAVWSAMQTKGPLKFAFATTLLVLAVASLDSTVEENRTTWILLGLAAVAGRLAVEEPEELAACFAAAERTVAAAPIQHLNPQLERGPSYYQDAFRQ